MDKKGFEVQFNWIFVLVAGAAILLFFSAIVIKQKSVADISTKATVLKNVEAIITGAGISTDTTNTISIPESSIEISCGRISLGAVSKQYENLILFAPASIKGNRLITQTLSFNAPYKATNLLYITNPEIRYILIGSSSLAKEINKTLPSELKKEFYKSLSDIKGTNNHKVRIIAFESMTEFPKALAKMPDSDVTAVRVNGDAEKGIIEFWQKEGNSWQSNGKSYYIGKSSLIGAAYSDTAEAYECGMQNAFSKLNLVTKVNIDKTNKLMQKSSDARQVQCTQFYSNALAHLNKILPSGTFSQESINAIAESAKSLAEENKNSQIHSCPLIY
ncbi:hypothetical protein HYV80_00320 [Candidatus Woesearchaeota archaeon]|nr:hypothetical protein [Candidatus Woesearchaeota archaeon]